MVRSSRDFRSIPYTVRQAKVPKVLIGSTVAIGCLFRRYPQAVRTSRATEGYAVPEVGVGCLDTIPYGRTMTYQGIGDRIGGKAIARTVGNACGSNPIPIIVPCHRVIAADGLLTGYVGGLWRKKWLLEHEGALPKELF
jgi:methylated-DNA-[protein]-cysteine S-methyltransferase